MTRPSLDTFSPRERRSVLVAWDISPRRRSSSSSRHAKRPLSSNSCLCPALLPVFRVVKRHALRSYRPCAPTSAVFSDLEASIDGSDSGMAASGSSSNVEKGHIGGRQQRDDSPNLRFLQWTALSSHT